MSLGSKLPPLRGERIEEWLGEPLHDPILGCQGPENLNECVETVSPLKVSNSPDHHGIPVFLVYIALMGNLSRFRLSETLKVSRHNQRYRSWKYTE